MKRSAENKQFRFGLTQAEFLNYLSFYQLAKFKNLATSQKCPNLCVSNDLHYVLYTLLPVVLLFNLLFLFVLAFFYSLALFLPSAFLYQLL